jgi:cellobiose-specific phosphotransferase system component IIA
MASSKQEVLDTLDERIYAIAEQVAKDLDREELDLNEAEKTLKKAHECLQKLDALRSFVKNGHEHTNTW